MANILGIFTAIILLVSAFVAWKNKTRLEEEIGNRATELSSLEKSQARLKAGQVELNQLPEDRAVIDAEFAAKSEEETKAKEANAAIQEDIDSKASKISNTKAKLEGIREKSSKIGDIAGIAEKMKTTRMELEELDAKITGSEATLANLTARNTSVQTEAKRRKEDLEAFNKGDSLPSLKTRIRNIYPAWGFVTLADGNNAGVVANSVLNVVRDGETVARLLVTAVESRSASASIIPDSIGEDVTLMVGDRVVPGSKDEKKSASN